MNQYYTEYLILSGGHIVGSGFSSFNAVLLTESAIAAARQEILRKFLEESPAAMVEIALTLIQKLDNSSENNERTETSDYPV